MRVRQFLRMAWLILYPLAFIGILTLPVEPGMRMVVLVILIASAAFAAFVLFQERRDSREPDSERRG